MKKIIVLLLFCFNLAQAKNLTEFIDNNEVPTWATASFEGLLETGVIKGNHQNQLNPLSPINRAEFTKILLEAANQTLIDPRPNTFNDVHPEHWFYTYIETAADLGWVTGYNDESFKPGNAINRAEIAKLLDKAFSLGASPDPSDETWFDAELRALNEQKLLPYNTTRGTFEFSTIPTRAEAFDQIYRAMLKYKFTDQESNSKYEDIYQTPSSFKALTKESQAGNLNVSGLKKVTANIKPDQNNVNLGTFIFAAENGSTQLNGLQFRRIGNGSFNSYQHLWLEIEGQKIAPNVTPTTDIVTLNFTSLQNIASGQSVSLELKGDLKSTAKLGSSERFVLYLPNWVSSNTDRVIGFFPIAGNNVNIR
ncbi:hypothetical protein GW777_06030 [Candidatus Peregrinibacteria bacterium]|nr:hypothetical protein [bacterium]NCQ55845.1 hypothetical protein [Candidatus Parcubacteria bacterium]NCS67912.1 hypothetical protein [Candidatus Peregrinibacteria bacterium]